MNKKLIAISKGCFFLLFNFLLFSCGKSDDPLKSVDFGISDPEEITGIFEQQKLLSLDEEGNTFIKINGEKSNLRSTFEVNEYYNFKKLESLTMRYGADSSYLQVNGIKEYYYSPASGATSKSKLDSITQMYISWYGIPSFRFKSREYLRFIDEADKKNTYLKGIQEEKPEYYKYLIDDVGYDYIIWKSPQHNILMYYNFYESDSAYHNVTLRYESPDFHQTHMVYRDSLSSLATPTDLVEIGNIYIKPFEKTESPYTDRMQIQFDWLTHNLPVESRGIKKFKFDLILMDEYEDELLKLEGLEIEPSIPLASAIYPGYPSPRTSESYTHRVDYYRYSDKSKDFEKVRKEREKGWDQVKTRYEITSVIFEDGEVLK